MSSGSRPKLGFHPFQLADDNLFLFVQAQRGIPLSHDAIIAHAADIAQMEIGESWIRNFRKRHPNLRVRWTSSLEECRAKSLTPEVVCMSKHPLSFGLQ